jgi:hypothetical protein
MTTTTVAIAPSEAALPARHLGTTARAAALVAGVMFAAEAVASPFVHSHVGYHVPNAVLNTGLFVVCVALVRLGRRVVGWAGVVGGSITAFAGLLAALGGIDVAVVEGLGSGKAGDVVEGIAHTAVLPAAHGLSGTSGRGSSWRRGSGCGSIFPSVRFSALLTARLADGAGRARRRAPSCAEPPRTPACDGALRHTSCVTRTRSRWPTKASR